MVKSKLLIPLLFFPIFLFSQEKGQYINKGVLRAQLTLSAGDMLHYKDAVNLFLHGDLGYYLDEKISLRGDSYYYLGNIEGEDLFDQNHSTFAGIVYHFGTNSHIDPFVGFQPGVAITRQAPVIMAGNPDIQIEGNSMKFSPLVSGLAGINFYGSDYFHLFLNIRYLQGNYMSFYNTVPLDELRISAGLGWNFDLSKSK